MTELKLPKSVESRGLGTNADSIGRSEEAIVRLGYVTVNLQMVKNHCMRRIGYSPWEIGWVLCI